MSEFFTKLLTLRFAVISNDRSNSNENMSFNNGNDFSKCAVPDLGLFLQGGSRRPLPRRACYGVKLMVDKDSCEAEICPPYERKFPKRMKFHLK